MPTEQRFQCRHLFTDGHRCGSPSLREEHFCFYHHNTRKPVARTSRPRSGFDLPLLEDRSAVQAAIGQVLQRVAGNQLDSKRAGLLLYGLQIASLNLPRLKLETQAQPLPVADIVEDPKLGLVAPITDFVNAKHKRTIEEVLMEQWAKDEVAMKEREAQEQAQAAKYDVPHVQDSNKLPTIQATAACGVQTHPKAKSRPKSYRLKTLRKKSGGRGCQRRRISATIDSRPMLTIPEPLRPTLARLQEEVLEANLALVKAGLVLFTFGNASGIHRASGLVVIKPSGVDYAQLRPEHMVITDLHGELAPDSLKPSSDLHTHLHLYRSFASIGGIVHTHSLYATSWAQAGREIPAFGTTHADYFHGPVPVTAPLEAAEIAGEYVLNTGIAITRRFAQGNPALDPAAVPAVLVHGHAPFVWGPTVHDAAHNAIVLENVAQLALNTLTLTPNCPPVSQHLLDRHHYRKHGANATYGQLAQQ